MKVQTPMKAQARPPIRSTARGRAALVGLVLYLAAAPAYAQPLRIYHVDVNQGDATLFVAPSGRTLLVDSGNNGNGDEVVAALHAAGADRIDAFVATHLHADHIGGIDEVVAAGVEVRRAFDRGMKAGALAAGGVVLQAYEDAVGHRARALAPGDTIALDPALRITCVAASGWVLGEDTGGGPPSEPTGHDENDNSVALLVEMGPFRYFVGGDIEEQTEGKLAAHDAVLDVDVYQADHHGSHTSSSEAFLTDLAPSVVVISNGNHGLYRHPRQVTLDRFALMDPPPLVVQTNRYTKGGLGGNVDELFIADLDPDGYEGTVLVAYDPAGETIAVSYRGVLTLVPVKERAAAFTVVVTRLLPDPVGLDDALEEVTLRNGGTSAVSLAGWRLRDRAGNTSSLTGLGTLGPGDEATLVRQGQAMSLNNFGDEVVLLDGDGAERDRVAYGPVEEGEEVVPGL